MATKTHCSLFEWRYTILGVAVGITDEPGSVGIICDQELLG